MVRNDILVPLTFGTNRIKTETMHVDNRSSL